jgi:hypothetical protein
MPQAASRKPQAASRELCKPQAASRELWKPQATILNPGSVHVSGGGALFLSGKTAEISAESPQKKVVFTPWGKVKHKGGGKTETAF